MTRTAQEHQAGGRHQPALLKGGARPMRAELLQTLSARVGPHLSRCKRLSLGKSVTWRGLPPPYPAAQAARETSPHPSELCVQELYVYERGREPQEVAGAP